MFFISSSVLEEFYNFVIFGCVSLLLTLILFGISAVVKPSLPDLEKLSSYECGFQPFSFFTRLPFTISYYLIALLFIIFDIEVVFFLPLVFSINLVLTSVIFLTVVSLLGLLVLGFLYEWKTGSINFILD